MIKKMNESIINIEERIQLDKLNSVLDTYKQKSFQNNSNSPKLDFSISNCHVISLKLQFFKLKKIPIEVFKFGYLENLYLEGNEIQEIPSEIENLKYLKVLVLSLNPLNSLPHSLSKLQNLSELDLSRTNFTRIPLVFQNLSSLKDLTLERVQLKTLHGLPSKFIEKIILSILFYLDEIGDEYCSLPTNAIKLIRELENGIVSSEKRSEKIKDIESYFKPSLSELIDAFISGKIKENEKERLIFEMTPNLWQKLVPYLSPNSLLFNQIIQNLGYWNFFHEMSLEEYFI